MYLTDLFPPEALIVGMLLAPLLDVHVPTLEIVRIRLDPFPLAFALTLGPALRLPTTLLGLPRPGIRPVIPAAVETSLLSSLCGFHIPILDRRCLVSSWRGLPGNKKELNTSWVRGKLKEE